MWAKLGAVLAVVAFMALGAALTRLSPQAVNADSRKQEPSSYAILEKIAAEVEHLSRKIESERGVGDRLESIASQCETTDESIHQLHEAITELRKKSSQDSAMLGRAILKPSVQVSIRGSVGGGTIIRSQAEEDEAYGTYVITAFHVVQKAIDKDEEGREVRHPIRVRMIGSEETAIEETVDSDLILHEERKDLALLKLRSKKAYPVSARLASRDRVRASHVFTPIYAVGCPLGHDPLPSFGEITTHHKEVNGERFWMMSAPTIFGNSGGGVFLRDTFEMIGVSAMICTFENPVTMPVPHLGILVPLDIVYDWLGANYYQFLFDSEYTYQRCAQERAEALKSSSNAAPAGAQR